jgi:hypothetical protein
MMALDPRWRPGCWSTPRWLSFIRGGQPISAFHSGGSFAAGQGGNSAATNFHNTNESRRYALDI